MRILLFYDTPRQKNYFNLLKECFASEQEVEVVAAGYGATGEYFGIKDSEQLALAPNDASAGHVPWRLRVAKYLCSIVPKFSKNFRLLAKEVQYMSDSLDMIEKINPDLIVVLEDNVEGLVSYVTFNSKQKNIPYVVLPDYIPNPIEPARYYSTNPNHITSRYSSLVYRAFFPRWLIEFEEKSILRLSLPRLLFNLLLNKHSVLPWVLNSGYTEKILIESKQLKDRYLNLGFKAEKLKIIGSPIDNVLFDVTSNIEERRLELAKSLNLDSNKKLLICGFPPDQYSISSDEYEFDSFESLVRAWIQALKLVESTHHVIIRPHPRLDKSLLTPFLTSNMHLTDLPTESLVPLADTYVACISTTIRWALALGIPVVNYDCYRYQYGDFEQALGIEEVYDLSSFKSVLSRVSKNDDDWINTCKGALSDKENWGEIDGGFQKRVTNSVYSAIRDFSQFTPTHEKEKLGGTWRAMQSSL